MGGEVADAIAYWEACWGAQPGIYMLELVGSFNNLAPAVAGLSRNEYHVAW